MSERVITWNRERLDTLRRYYDAARETMAESFVIPADEFDGQEAEFVTEYARYMIAYLEGALRDEH